jgi:L-histidine Nalpha-methyltransferase
VTAKFASLLDNAFRLGEKAPMPAPVHVAIHPSQFPGAIQRDLVRSLRRRQVNPKFLYDSRRQAQRWLALHKAHSPSRTDPDCRTIYIRGFKAAVRGLPNRPVHVIGLGCGGGTKDSRLLHLLEAARLNPTYAPCDVSLALVLSAQTAAVDFISADRCFPLVCDLGAATDLHRVFEEQTPRNASRLLTFFGMIPNFEPRRILPKLRSFLRPLDRLLFSANLVPRPDAASMRRILPQYENELTRDWLMTFLSDLGIERGDGRLRFGFETDIANGAARRFVADFRFSRNCRVLDARPPVTFRRGEGLRVFFSYRYTPDHLATLLKRFGIRVMEQWITKSCEEGVFLCRSTPTARVR